MDQLRNIWLTALLLTAALSAQIAESVDLLQDEVYVPGPQLDPSTDLLDFSGILPGESRTIFMDLANLGDGRIYLDSLHVGDNNLQVGLTRQTLDPGQFTRFPVSYTQTDRHSRRTELAIYWRSSSFKREDTLTVRIVAEPAPALAFVPEVVAWPLIYVGRRQTISLTIRNRSPLPVFFTRQTGTPSQIEISHLPPVLVGGASKRLKLSWLPLTAGPLEDSISVYGQVAGDSAVFNLPVRGNARHPVSAAVDTLRPGTLLAGNDYRLRVALANHSDRKVTLYRRSKREVFGANRVKSSARITLRPSSTAILPINLVAHAEGKWYTDITYYRLLKVAPDRLDTLAGFTVNLQTYVELPLVLGNTVIRFPDQPVLESGHYNLSIFNAGPVSIPADLSLASGSGIFSLPLLPFRVPSGAGTQVPVYFNPTQVTTYQDTLLISYRTGDKEQLAGIILVGTGLDQPLTHTAPMPDINLSEDFEPETFIGLLGDYYRDRNDTIIYHIDHSFGDQVVLSIRDLDSLVVTAAANYHGTGEISVLAANKRDETATDTFRLRIKPVNDLPTVIKPLKDLVVREDQPTALVTRLSSVFLDPDHTLEHVKTYYDVYDLIGDAKVRLFIRDDQLLLAVAPDWTGMRSFVVAARDSADQSAAVYNDLKVTVLAVNDTPRVAHLPDLVLTEDVPTVVDWRPYVKDIDDAFSDLDLHFTAAGGGSLPVRFERISTSRTRIAPAPHWFGELRVKLTASDPNGAAGDGVFTLTVEPVDDPPGPFTIKAPFVPDWDHRLTFAGPDTLISFSWNPSKNHDPDDVITYSWQLLDASRGLVLKEIPAGSVSSVSSYFDSTGIYFWTVIARDREGTVAVSDTLPIMIESLQAPLIPIDGDLNLSLGPAYPNPLSLRAKIHYAIPKYSNVVITIYDTMGRKVRLLKSEAQYGGHYVVEWDGRDRDGKPVASGPYVVELRVGNLVRHLKLSVLR
ncbi:MAG: hypothetical protein KAU50_11890 [Candidatus Marinimicrobia bacterium]|nr:hypothetical protein [Candidatus Neomarinimicrobiota bacterium]